MEFPVVPPTRQPVFHPVTMPSASPAAGHRGNGLALRNLEVLEAVELDPAGDAGHGWLVVTAPGEVAGFLGLAGAGPAGAVADSELRIEDLQQEGGQGQVQAVRGKAARDGAGRGTCDRRPGTSPS
jgi:hypothetical protein